MIILVLVVVLGYTYFGGPKVPKILKDYKEMLLGVFVGILLHQFFGIRMEGIGEGIGEVIGEISDGDGSYSDPSGGTVAVEVTEPNRPNWSQYSSGIHRLTDLFGDDEKPGTARDKNDLLRSFGIGNVIIDRGGEPLYTCSNNAILTYGNTSINSNNDDTLKSLVDPGRVGIITCLNSLTGEMESGSLKLNDNMSRKNIILCDRTRQAQAQDGDGVKCVLRD